MTRGMTRLTKRESSLSRKLRHFVNSTVSKILARSRGLDNSVHESKPNMPAPAAVMKGAKAPAEILDISRNVSRSSGWFVHS